MTNYKVWNPKNSTSKKLMGSDTILFEEHEDTLKVKTDFHFLQIKLPRYKTVKAAKDSGIIKGQAFILEDINIKNESFDLIVIMR